MTKSTSTLGKTHLEMHLHDRALAGLEGVSIILSYLDALEEDPNTQAIDFFDSPEMRRDLLYAVWVLSRFARSNEVHHE